MDLDFKLPEDREGIKTLAKLIILVISSFALAFIITLSFAEIIKATGLFSGNKVVLYPLLIAIQGGSTIAVSLAYLHINKDYDIILLRKPTLRDIAITIGGFFALLLGIVIAGLIVNQLGVDSAESELSKVGKENPKIMLYLIPLAFISIGTSEELLFRGVIQKTLESAFGVHGAIILASFIFGTAHFLALSGGGKIVTLLIISVLGIILGVSYELTDNLIVPILIHGLYDTFVFLSVYAAGVS